MLENCQKLKDESCIAGTYFQLSELAQKDDNLEEARDFNQKSLHLFRRLGYKHGIASSLGQLGKIKKLQGDYVAAIRIWRRAYVLFEELQSIDKEIVKNCFIQLRDELGTYEFNNVCQKAGINVIFT